MKFNTPAPRPTVLSGPQDTSHIRPSDSIRGLYEAGSRLPSGLVPTPVPGIKAPARTTTPGTSGHGAVASTGQSRLNVCSLKTIIALNDQESWTPCLGASACTAHQCWIEDYHHDLRLCPALDFFVLKNC